MKNSTDASMYSLYWLGLLRLMSIDSPSVLIIWAVYESSLSFTIVLSENFTHTVLLENAVNYPNSLDSSQTTSKSFEDFTTASIFH